MNIFKTFLCCILCLSPFFSSAEEFSHDNLPSNALEYNEGPEEKVYIQPEQIYISYDGIFIFDSEGWAHVQQLNCDENGVYYFTENLDKITDKCPNGHKIWCNRCGGCVTRWCKFRCVCVEWE